MSSTNMETEFAISRTQGTVKMLSIEHRTDDVVVYTMDPGEAEALGNALITKARQTEDDE